MQPLLLQQAARVQAQGTAAWSAESARFRTARFFKRSGVAIRVRNARPRRVYRRWPLPRPICLPRFAQAYDFVGSYILGIGRRASDTAIADHGEAGGAAPRRPGLGFIRPPAFRMRWARSSSIVPLHPAMHIYATLTDRGGTRLMDVVNSHRAPRVGDVCVCSRVCVRDCQCG